MPRQTTVITPENIPLTLELAGLGTRFGALLIDILIQIAIALVLFFGGLIAVAFAEGFVKGLGSIGIALLIIAGFLLLFGYFILFETIWNGQTPGKRAFHLRVVRDGGYPITFFASATRNLIRLVDFLPISYGIGSLSMFFNREYKRLGDIVAGTIVIKERMAIPITAAQSAGLQLFDGAQLPDGVNNPIDVLSSEELAFLRRFAIRRWQMTADDSERFAYRLIVPLVARLNLTFMPGIPPRYADLVSTLVAAADKEETKREAVSDAPRHFI